MNSPIVVFYKEKIIGIFTSFFIKYFYKHNEMFKYVIQKETTDKEKYDTFKKFLLGFSKNTDEINKSFDMFEVYIKRKYNLDYTTLNTSLYIFIKESMHDMLMTKISYEKKDELENFYNKCCKKIACNLYESTDDSYLEYKKIIQNDVKNLLNELLPIDIITSKYNEIQKSLYKKDLDKAYADKHLDKYSNKLNEKENTLSEKEKYNSYQSHKVNSCSNVALPSITHSNNKSQSDSSETSESTIKLKKYDMHNSSSYKKTSSHKRGSSHKGGSSSNVEYSDVMYDQYYSSDSEEKSKKEYKEQKEDHKENYKDDYNEKRDEHKDDLIKKIKLDNPIKKN